MLAQSALIQSSSTERTDPLSATLDAAVRDRQTVTREGEPIERLLDGVSIRKVPTQSDVRGSVVEMYDARWNWHPAPLVYAYTFTIRPGYAKAWALHKHHDDRYFIIQGEMEVVLYDGPPRIKNLWPDLPDRAVPA